MTGRARDVFALCAVACSSRIDINASPHRTVVTMEWIPRGLSSLHAPIPVCGGTIVRFGSDEGRRCPDGCGGI